MPSRHVFHWPEGRGWLIFSGGMLRGDEARALALTRAAADGAVAYVTMTGSPESAERALEDMEDLGAPAGYIVDVTAEDDATIKTRLADAGLIVIEAAPTATDARSLLLGAAIEGIQTAYQNGALVLAEGASAMAFGAWVVTETGELVSGLDWLRGALIAPGITEAASWARDILVAQPLVCVVGIGVGSALALGPDGQVEIWGRGEVTVALGRGHSQYTGEQ